MVELLTRHEAARYLRVSAWALDSFTARREDDHPLPRLQAGRRYLFDPSALVAWAKVEAERAVAARRQRTAGSGDAPCFTAKKRKARGR